MFFRPSFCANCGEKIERREWGVFTSRRFCPVCESQFKGVDLIPRAVVAAGILVGVLGVGGYMKSGNVADQRVARLSAPPVERLAAPQTRDQLPANAVAVPTPSTPNSPASAPVVQPKTSTAGPAAEVARNTSQDVVYMCGAQTKKGTPCSRRVHGPVRCFQHTGMPAMVAQEKLKLS